MYSLNLPNRNMPLIPVRERFTALPESRRSALPESGRTNTLSLQKKKKPVQLKQPDSGYRINWENAMPATQPAEFGPHYWYMLHTMALNYPNDPTDFIKEKMKCFVEALPFLLPCKDCSEHAKEFLATHKNKINGALQSKESLFKFLWYFHNHVNARLQKPQISLKKAFLMYKK